MKPIFHTLLRAQRHACLVLLWPPKEASSSTFSQGEAEPAMTLPSAKRNDRRTDHEHLTGLSVQKQMSKLKGQLCGNGGGLAGAS